MALIGSREESGQDEGDLEGCLEGHIYVDKILNSILCTTAITSFLPNEKYYMQNCYELQSMGLAWSINLSTLFQISNYN